MEATPEDVRYAYRLLLGREPDEGGKATFEQLIAQRKMAPDALADVLMQSAEYRGRKELGQQLLRHDLGEYSVFSRKGDALIGSHLAEGIAYEPYVMDHFDAALASAEVVLDIGANIGLFTLRAASRLAGRGRVIAVEPLPQNQQALYASIRYNGFSNVAVLPFAASDASGLVAMSCDENSSNGIVRVAGDDGSAVTIVPAHPLDWVLASLERLDVIKIDIEGHEPIAWQGLTGLLERLRPVVFLEFSPVAIRGNKHTTPEQFAAQLLEYSPSIRILHRDRDPVDCRSAQAIMAEWEAANRSLGLDGEMHVDLLLSPDH